MTTTIDGLTGQTTTDPDDLIVIQNVAANRTRKIVMLISLLSLQQIWILSPLLN